MRGRLNPQRSMLDFIELEERVPPDHPLRLIKRLADDALAAIAVEGTLIEAAASLKSFHRRDGEPPAAPPDDPGKRSVDFHGERRSNATHSSTTDPEARLLRKGKGKEAKLYFLAHALMENRHGLLTGSPWLAPAYWSAPLIVATRCFNSLLV